MKIGTLRSVKFMKLSRRLNLPQWQCVGLLESLWLFTQSNAIKGDIGRFSNEDIAASIGYQDDPDELIKHMVETGWIDRCEASRLCVHDWQDHCPTWIKGAIASEEKREGAKGVAKPPSIAPRLSPPAKDEAKPSTTFPSLPLPNLTIPNSAADEPPKRQRKPESKPRERDALFDAIADVTGSDPKASGGYIAKVRKSLAESEPPYTPDDVRKFADPSFLTLELPWLNGRKPTLSEVEKNIGRTRNPSKPQQAQWYDPMPGGS